MASAISTNDDYTLNPDGTYGWITTHNNISVESLVKDNTDEKVSERHIIPFDNTSTVSYLTNVMLGLDLLTAIQAKVEEIGSRTKSLLRQLILSTFQDAKYEDVEDLIESQFAYKISDFINNFGSMAIEIIAEIILGKQAEIGVSADALEIVGLIEYESHHSDRRRLLERCLLKSESAWVRDGAIRGISYLDDPKSLPYVKQALEKEIELPLQRDINRVIEQLQKTHLELSE